MDTSTLNYELEHYAADRLKTTDAEAFRRLYLRSLARCSGVELSTYLDLLRRRAMAYAAISHLLKSPFRNIESPLFLSSVTLVLSGIAMTCSGDFSELVAGGTSAGIVGMLHCGRRFIELWQHHDVEEALFLELAELLTRETEQAEQAG